MKAINQYVIVDLNGDIVDQTNSVNADAAWYAAFHVSDEFGVKRLQSLGFRSVRVRIEEIKEAK